MWRQLRSLNFKFGDKIQTQVILMEDLGPAFSFESLTLMGGFKLSLAGDLARPDIDL